MKKNYSTDEIVESIKSGNHLNPNDITFYSEEEYHADLNNISKDIQQYIESGNGRASFNEFAKETYITPSHLNQFLSGQKKMTKYYLLRIFITLGYDLNKINSLLQRFDNTSLYARERRDFVIMNGIVDKRSLDDIDSELRSLNLEGLCPIEKK